MLSYETDVVGSGDGRQEAIHPLTMLPNNTKHLLQTFPSAAAGTPPNNTPSYLSALRRLDSVKSECHNVLSTLRLTHREHVHDRRRFKQEVLLRDELPTIRKLKQLAEFLVSQKEIEEIDATLVLEPFLDILRTPTNAVVAGVVLGSLNKFTLYGVFSRESPRVGEAVNQAVRAVASCRFESTHRLADEVVMIQIMDLLVNLLRCAVGDKITDDGVTIIIETCFKMTMDTDLSELLRAAAANQLSHVVLTVFARAPELHDGSNSKDGYGSTSLVHILQFLATLTDPSTTDTCRAMGLQLINIALETGGGALGVFPDAVAVLQNDLCKFLLQNSQTDDLALFALTLRVVYNLFTAIKGHIKVQLEVFLTSIHFRTIDSMSAPDEKKELALESLLDFAHDPSLMLWLHVNYDCDLACSDLFQQLCRLLCRAAVPSHVPSSSIVTGTPTPTTTATTVPLLPPANITSLNLLAFEGIFAIVSHVALRCRPHQDTIPNVSLVVNHDMIPSSSSQTTTPPSSNMDVDELIRRKTLKRRIGLVATQFNKAPGKPYWMEYGKEMGVLTTTVNPVGESSSSKTAAAKEVAHFLLETPALDKSAVGDFVSNRDDFAEMVLAEYIALIPGLGNLRVDDALRSVCCWCFVGVQVDGTNSAHAQVLEKFRIPGEAQKIERVMDVFATCYFASCPPSQTVFSSRDAVFIFAFSVVMLHTDAHSSSIANDKRMTLEQFIKNNRGINDGKDLPREFLAEVYAAVRSREFILTYDPSGTPVNAPTDLDEEWNGVLRHSRNVDAPRFLTSVDELKGARAGAHEKDMFHILSEPTSHALDTVLENTRDGRIVARCLRLSRDLAKIANFFNEQMDLNRLLIVLCRHSTVNLNNLTMLNFKHAEALQCLARAEDASGTTTTQETNVLLTTVENAAADPRGPIRAFLIARCCFFLASTHGGLMKEAWTNLVELLMELSRLGVIVVKPGGGGSGGKDNDGSDGQTIEERLLSPRTIRSPRGSLTGEEQQQQLVHVNADVGVNSDPVPPAGLWNVVVSFVFGENTSDNGTNADAARKREEDKAIDASRAFFRACQVPNSVFHESRHFSEDSLAYLLSALCQPLIPAAPQKPIPRYVFTICWEALKAVVLANEHRAHLVWPVFDHVFQYLAANAMEPVRDILDMLTLDWITETMFLSLDNIEIVGTGSELDEAFMSAVTTHYRKFQRLDVWRVIYKKLHDWCTPQTRLQAFTMFVDHEVDGATTNKGLGNILVLVDAITTLWLDNAIETGNDVQRGAVTLVGRLAKAMLIENSLDSSMASDGGTSQGGAVRFDLFVMMLVSLRTWYANSNTVMAHNMIAETLQTVLISNDLSLLTLQSWIIVFQRVLFPMLVQSSLSSSPGRRVMTVIDYTAPNLVAKVFCCHAETLSSLLPKVISALVDDFVEMKRNNNNVMTDNEMKDVTESFRQRLLNLLRVVVDRVQVDDWIEAGTILDGFDDLKGWKDEVGR